MKLLEKPFFFFNNAETAVTFTPKLSVYPTYLLRLLLSMVPKECAFFCLMAMHVFYKRVDGQLHIKQYCQSTQELELR